jgi:hypothetical protein
MPRYILFLREPNTALEGLGPEEIQALIKRYKAWREGLSARTKEPGGHKLRDHSGRLMKMDHGKLVVTDGPYVETRDVLGGLFHFVVDSYEQAVAIASDCPHLELGTIEIREVELT